MRNWRIMGAVVYLFAASAATMHAQPAHSADRGAGVTISPSAYLHAVPTGEILREIDDPQLGSRWLLMRDDSHPGGPARLVLLSAAPGAARGTRQITPRTDTPPPVIRAGDRVVLEEHTLVVDAHLEAVAMGPAWTGSAFSARLSIGGGMVRALAAGNGRAVLQQETAP
jgi:hypothetical protein